ncbi:MAG: glycerophosphodiester phosphodiesterase [Clostridia bacterium]|nr:glycerophosphodiester phosphodiesterase [Clostridia bacterium]
MIFLLCPLAVLTLILFVFSPSLRKHKALSQINCRYIAHRGLHSEQVAENSLSAFALAAASGYAIELDIRLTADGEVVVFHDGDLKRMCGEAENVSSLTLSELKEYRLKTTDEKIPTLRECLSVAEKRVPLLIEFKCGKNDCKRLCEAAERILSDYKGLYFVQSFYPGVLFWYKRNRSAVCRGLLATHIRNYRFLSPFIFNFLTRPHFVSYSFKFSNSLGFRLQRLLGACAFGWTFHSEAEIDKKIFNAYIFEGFEPEK